ncbi:MAG: hypothetical protein FWE20_10670 [Defluviitaleaceae bacterium]|nr:hypothetical protein [Defluviitaleaceae bacterium]
MRVVQQWAPDVPIIVQEAAPNGIGTLEIELPNVNQDFRVEASLDNGNTWIYQDAEGLWWAFVALAQAQSFTVTFDLNGGTHTGGGELVQSVPLNGAAEEPEVYLIYSRLYRLGFI